MSMLHHPAVQSLVLPWVAALLAMAVLGGWRPARSPRWAGLGAALGLLVALVIFPGFEWPAASRAQKFPWIVLLSVGVAVASVAVLRVQDLRWPLWALGTALWAMASIWLTGGGGGAPAFQSVAWLLGGSALMALVLLPGASPPEAAQKPTPVAGQACISAGAVLAVVAAGQAAMAAMGGSLLIAQLAMALAVVTGMLALWGWLAPDAPGLCSRPALMPLALAWLALAQSLSATVAAGLLRSGLLALALCIPLALRRTGWAMRHPRWVPWLSVLLAAVPVALALLPVWADGAIAPGGAGADTDDPYYRSDWD
ncbi:MAG: hypothetical protein MUF76_03530 [Hydrogenophaga sp.]|nr:hypothetical protein [Hydrogenophaga sp.]